ncbi:MAG TPA: flagellar hook-basal body complex protein [Phycisphaerales bacterium]|nr:flagellar hook-basal body complex protein [Phycisphaerales bacterium]
MASTTALFTGLSGMTANSRNIDVIGNNIANVNTTSYKSSRMLFSTMFSRNMTAGSAPSEARGGSNPFQIGYGVQAGGTQRNMTGGAISATGDARDLAIDGAGFFVMNRGPSQVFTRAGAFRANQNNDLVDLAGNRLQGFGVDANFNIIPGQLIDLNVPLGSMTLAEATRNVKFSGNLNSDGLLPTQGARINLTGTGSNALRAITTANPAPTAPDIIDRTTRLVDIEDPTLLGSDTPLFTAGQRFEIKGAEKGGKQLPTASFAVTATTTIDDLNTFLAEALGIDLNAGANPDGSMPGVDINGVTGEISIIGNTGTANDLVIDVADLRITNGAGTFLRSPFASAKAVAADGESVRTTFVAFDSLGSPVEVDLTLTLESRGVNGTTWRYSVESVDDSDIALQVGSGTVSFDSNGQPLNPLPLGIAIDRDGSGADSPLSISLSFTGNDGSNGVTSLSDSRSTLAATARDGAPIGTLSAYAVGADGIITGAFTNGLTRTLGQVAIATFANPEGMVDAGNSMFTVGANSGNPVITAAGEFSAGSVIGGALELSNVDLGEEFIKLILSSTGYSASSRVIRTADDLMQQLMTLGR